MKNFYNGLIWLCFVWKRGRGLFFLILKRSNYLWKSVIKRKNFCQEWGGNLNLYRIMEVTQLIVCKSLPRSGQM